MGEKCCESGTEQNGVTMILSCSGGSNVGQLANQAAVELTREGYGKSKICLWQIVDPPPVECFSLPE